ncbi:hypothetical protein F3J16_08910 [Burkholderia sp. Ap-962]|uniref:hypothetical protein n=1 Tax=Burkholderia sp. Ap-962 TaxID=2608333 RepID=UPI0014221547|nr:hypothetical protein [Burkholderia sp. Ap-962]NIF70301.1 hypothetical protein [Burkholderia sp. Ap-962]
MSQDLRVTIPAFAMVALLHALALLAFQIPARPSQGQRQQERRALTVRLIPLEAPRPQAAPSSRVSSAFRAAAPSRWRAGTASIPARPAGVHASLARPPDTEHRHQAFAGGAAVASQAPPANLDWQADLRGIGKPPFARGGGGGTRGDAAAREPVKPAQGTAAQLDRDISKAARGDCRNRYAGMGLLAIPMLAAYAMNQSGCRW